MKIDRGNNGTILFLAVLLRIVFLIFVLRTEAYISPDSPGYYDLGVNLAEGKGFVDANGKTEINRTPVYPLVIALAYRIAAKHWYLIVILIQMLIGALTYCFVYRKLVRLYLREEKYIRLAECFFLFDYLSIYYSCMILTDFLFSQMAILLLYMLSLHWKKEQGRFLIISGALLGVMTLLRPVAQYLGIALAVGIFVVYVSRKKPVLACKNAALILMFAIMLTGGWMLRNYYKTGNLAVSTIMDINISEYNASAILADLEHRSYYDVHVERSAYARSISEDKELYQKFIDDSYVLIKSHPGIFLKYCALGAGCIFIYPGALDFLREYPVFGEKLQEVKQTFSNGGGLGHKMLSVLKKCSDHPLSLCLGGLLLLIDILILIYFFILLVRFIVRKNDQMQWYEKWMMIGILVYFVLCSCFPNGYGSYSRFRLPILGILFLCVCIEKEQARKVRPQNAQ